MVKVGVPSPALQLLPDACSQVAVRIDAARSRTWSHVLPAPSKCSQGLPSPVFGRGAAGDENRRNKNPTPPAPPLCLSSLLPFSRASPPLLSALF